MATDPVSYVHDRFSEIYLAGIPRLLNDDGAFLSFVTGVTGIEALAGYFNPDAGNGDRFRGFARRYLPAPLNGMDVDLWKFRNAVVHAFNPGPFALCHHQSRRHMTQHAGRTFLNAEDFYAALVHATSAYFADLQTDTVLQANFSKKAAAESIAVVLVSST